MNYEETLKLIDAGFTADEIRKMAEEGTPGPQDKPGTAEELGAGSAEHAGKVEPEVSEEVKALSAEIAKLNETVKLMQAENVKNARTGSAQGAPDPVKEHIDAFLKEL